MLVPASSAQLPSSHSTTRLCEMQDLEELFDETLNLSNLSESVSRCRCEKRFQEDEEGECLALVEWCL